MIPRKVFPKNFGYIITILSLGLVVLGLSTYLYNSYLSSDNQDAREVEEGNSNSGVSSDDDYSYTDGKGVPTTPSIPGQDGNSGAKNANEQKVVKTGTLKISVDDFDETSSSVRSFSKQLGGFVTYSNDYGEGKDRTLTMTVKVPAASFDSFVDKVKTYGVEVISFSESVTDVTQTYTDLKARLKNQKAVESRLVDILDKATKVTEILEVERQLSSTQQTIEQLQAQIDYFDAQIDMSSVTITMTLNPESLDVTGDTWQPVGIFKEAVKALVMMFKELGTLAIWTVVFSPVFILIYLIYKAITRKK